MPPTTSAGGKRRRGGAASRGRKKQKRLDAIRDFTPPPPPLAGGQADDALRRSTRVRRAPALLDTSPLSSPRRKNPRRGGGEAGASGSSRRWRKGKNRRKVATRGKEVAEAEVEAGTEVWGSRLRDRVKGRAKLEKRGKRLRLEEEEEEEEEVGMVVADVQEVAEETKGGLYSQVKESRRKEINLTIDLNVEAPEAVEEIAVEEGGGGEEEEEEEAIPPRNDQEEAEEEEEEEEGEEEEGLQDEVKSEAPDLPVLEGVNDGDLACDEKNEEARSEKSGENEQLDMQDEQIVEETKVPVQQQSEDGSGSGEQAEEVRPDEPMDDAPNAVVAEEVPKETGWKSPISHDKGGVSDVKEGRRCGLCGGGTDGRPPKILVQDSAESENEAYEGALASEEPNYDVWDGFGDDPGWLGRLLGPIHDRFGIARVWVHQNCAVWSPEVYFAGLGCLKNVRAALCRGRLLKCSRCGRPGATIGCRVDRCPKTYHLPCSRADACIFDHRKFLIACNDHRHLFQPQGDKYQELLRKMKAKKMKTDMRKLSHDAWRKDIEAEEKWLENCGEDEEFLKREGRRLHRDLLRIAPVYIGGSSENEKSYCGWESVAGLNDVIQCMKEVVILPLLYPELFSSLGLAPPRGVLLHGYPGTGKTLVVRALIGACSHGNKRIAYFARKGADCLGKYVGDAERQLRLLFQVAERCQPSIIFFDEIDGLAPCRSRQQDQTHNSVVSTLLSLLDGLKSRGSVIVIGATNRPDAVDPALRRPGRFDREIYFPLPTFEDRSAILSLHTKSWPNPMSGAFLSFIASQTVGYAGADLQAICTQAALNALKRTCALQELLCSAEKGFEHGRLPSLPSILVEERDWLAALAAAPPPCSRREAGIAANDLVSSPLDPHLVPCHLKPLLYLLISLYLDERIWLPSSLLKASASVKDVVFSTMEKNKVPYALWSSHLHSLIRQQDIANRVKTILSRYGLLSAQLGNHSSMTLGNDDGKHEKFDGFRLKSTGSLMQGGLAHKSSGFRALVAGAPRSGQQHLVGCLLHGFMGQIEIHKVNLATMAQEGNGDILSGLTQILLKCLNLGRCIIYMPRIDLWAIDKTHELEMKNCGIDAETSKLPSSPIKSIRKSSEVWNSFIEQMGSSSASVSTTILATCELQFQDLPSGIRQLFGADVLDQCVAPSEHTIPRFSVNIDGYFNRDHVINSCALRLSQDLIQHYVQLLHGRAHKSNNDEQKEDFDTVEISTLDKNKTSENKESTIVTESPMDLDKQALNGVSCSDNPTQLGTNSSQQEPLSSSMRGQEEHAHKIDFQERIPRNPHNRIVKGNESLAIAAFGYQILRHPQFSKLCWVSSKLQEGPCTDINGPWKGWPFNSCLLHGSSSPDKSIAGVSNVLKGKEKCGCVRGLVAVGLMAYRGVYTSVMEVCAEVRTVLELLVAQIRAKILEKKDRYRYFHILSQVAYLEDIVNSWAYPFQRLHIDNRTGAPNTKPMTVENSVQVAPDGCPSEIQDIPVQHSPDQLETRNGVCPFDNHHVISTSSRTTMQQDDLLQSASSDMYKSSLTPANTVMNDGETCGVSSDGKTCRVINGEEACRSAIQRPESQTESGEHLNDLQTVENAVSSLARLGNSSISSSMLSSEAHDKCNDLNIPLNDVGSGQIVTDRTHDSVKNLSVTKASCVYKCCNACFHGVYKSVHDILSNSLRSNLHCLTVDDMHDILSSCSLNLLVAIRKCYSFQDVAGCKENFANKQSRGILLEPCACQEITDMQLNKNQRQVDFLPRECICHLGNGEDTGTTNTESYSLCEQPLSFFLKDGVLMPSDLTVDDALHCSFKRLCVCSILGPIFMFSQTSR